MSWRIERRFQALKKEGRSGLVTFTMMGDPDIETSFEILRGLPGAGADIIEIGSPFTDPMADGPVIQVAGQRALKGGITLEKTIDLVRRFREEDGETPLILMGYYNPIYIHGVDRFLEDAIEAGADGLIIVDLPPEEDPELCLPAVKVGLPFIRLVTPTTDDTRLPTVLENTVGFVYYVSIMGITGTQDVPIDLVRKSVARLKKHTVLPVAVGFGIKTREQAAMISQVADAAIVGTAVVNVIAGKLDMNGDPEPDTVGNIVDLVSDLAAGVRGARN